MRNSFRLQVQLKSVMTNASHSIHPVLDFSIISKCPVTKARSGVMKLPHYSVKLPMFMPVGTQGTIKGLTPKQVEGAGAQIILGNTYHLGTRPGKELLEQYQSLHEFMKWDRALLTDSGGFQMVSLLELAKITDEGVRFRSPYDGSECMLTPEESIHIQNAIGADIMMQLDDVVHVNETEYERFEIAVQRTTDWLDRCLKANRNPEKQALFPIVQGGLFTDLRKRSLEQLIKRDTLGYAIGGLSGGEEKNKFWPTVKLCTDHLPENKPRYCMGVGYPVDLVVCCALGVDMFDCVYPTRTARFGSALVDGGQINLKNSKYKFDFSPIDETCNCMTCKNYTKAYIKAVYNNGTIGCHLLSIHNIAHLMRLMENIQESLKQGKFVEFVRDFMNIYYKDGNIPQWIIDALKSVNITLQKGNKIEETIPDENWDDGEDDRCYLERVSGFRLSHFNNGFREAVLDDYEDATEQGRLLGFKTASSYVSLQRDECKSSDHSAGKHNSESAGKQCSESDGKQSSESDGKQSYKFSNSRELSQWLGTLLACQALKKDISHDDSLRIKDLISEIKTLLQKIYNLSEDEVHKFCSSRRENEMDSQGSNYNKFVYSQESILRINECRTLCDSIGWKVPHG